MAKITMRSFVDGISRDMEKAKDKALRKAGRLGAKKIRQEIDVVGIQSNTKKLKRGIGFKLADDRQSVFVGPGPKAYHAHLLDQGTTMRTQTSTGKNTGNIEPHPFIFPALEKAANDIADVLSEQWI